MCYWTIVVLILALILIPIGPITVFNSTVYDIMKPTGVNYLGFMAWIGM